MQCGTRILWLRYKKARFMAVGVAKTLRHGWKPGNMILRSLPVPESLIPCLSTSVSGIQPMNGPKRKSRNSSARHCHDKRFKQIQSTLCSAHKIVRLAFDSGFVENDIWK